VIDDLKEKAKAAGLWNMFLSKHAYAEGFNLTNLEYGLIAMILGRSGLASEVRANNITEEPIHFC
jgi:acyl-CoA dehydrogenase